MKPSEYTVKEFFKDYLKKTYPGCELVAPFKDIILSKKNINMQHFLQSDNLEVKVIEDPRFFDSKVLYRCTISNCVLDKKLPHPPITKEYKKFLGLLYPTKDDLKFSREVEEYFGKNTYATEDNFGVIIQLANESGYDTYKNLTGRIGDSYDFFFKTDYRDHLPAEVRDFDKIMSVI